MAPIAPASRGLADLRLYHRALWMVWVSALTLMTLISGYAYHQSVQVRERELEAVAKDLSNLTRVGQEHAERVLRGADQVIRFVQDAYLRQGKSLNLRDLTERGVIDAQLYNQLGIIDEKGIYILANLPTDGRLDLSDREHFRVHVNAEEDRLWVSKPVIGRASKRWSIQLTRRITRDDGSFAGVVVASIDPSYFTRFYAELQLGERAELSLIGLDGVARARRVGEREEYGTAASDAPMLRRVAVGERQGAYQHLAVIDGVERFYQFRRLVGFDLVLLAGIATQDVMARYEETRRSIWQQALAMIALTLLLAGALLRYFVNVRAAMTSTAQAQDLLQQRTEQLGAIFALSPDGFVSFDQRRRVLHVNPAFLRLTGAEDISLHGLDEHDFSSWLSLRCVPEKRFIGIGALQAEARDAVVPGKSHLIEIEQPVRRVLQVTLRAQSSAAVTQLLHVRDVTTETSIEAAKSEFMAVAAHELRAPMTSILGYTEVLLNEAFDDKTRQELLTIVLKQSRAMAHILDELLDLARIEAGKGAEFRFRAISVWDLIKDTLEGLPVPDRRPIPSVEMPDKTLFIRADARKMQQALTNVLANAFRYSGPQASVSIRVDANSDAAGKPWVSITVRDQGIGMSDEQVGRVFERFYRANVGDGRDGSGLGMSIVKEIMDLHGAQVRIKSELGSGTEVTLCLPAHR